MYCTNSNKTKYNIVGFHKGKFGAFNNEPYTENTIPTISILDFNNYHIKAIERIYEYASMHSIKIIELSQNSYLNAKKLILTHNEFLLYGFKYKNFIYSLLNKRKNPTTENLLKNSIIIINFPNDGNIFNFSNEVKRFKITPNGLVTYTLPEVNKLLNKILISNASGSTIKPIVTIEFGTDNKEFLVKADDILLDPLTSNKVYFSFKLKDSTNENIKFISNIITDLSPESFVNDLKGENFEYDDILELTYLSPRNITITNYPQFPLNHIPTKTKEYYKITPDGLKEYIPTPMTATIPNIIVVKNRSTTLSIIRFNATTKQFQITANNLIPLLNIQDTIYFQLKLKDSSNKITKISSNIFTDKYPNKFLDDLNNEFFDFDDILELFYLEPKNILVVNYPNKGRNHIPSISKEYYRITSKGLISYTPPPPPAPPPSSITLPNEIIIRSTNNFLEVSRIGFNITDTSFMATSSSIVPNIKVGSQDYFTIKLRNTLTEDIKTEASIISNNVAEDLVNKLNGSPFNIGDFIELTYFIPALIQITNLPNTSPIYTPTVVKEFYTITSDSLVPYVPPVKPLPPATETLPNTIKIKGNDNSEVAHIQFDSGNKRFIVVTSNVIPNSSLGPEEYFIIKLRNSSDKRIKYFSFITANGDGRNLKHDFNNFPFEYNDLLELYYFNPNNIEISDVFGIGTIHIPTTNKEIYTLTTNGLVPYTETIDIPISVITVSNKDDEELVKIQFNSNNKFLATATENIVTADPDINTIKYFSFLSQKISGLLRFNAEFNVGETVDTFANRINEKDFSDLDNLTLSYYDKTKIKISNFENELMYTPTHINSKKLLIDNLPIMSNKFRLINTLLLTSEIGDVIATIQFNIITKKIIVISTNNIASQRDLWIVTLFTASKIIIKSVNISQNMTGSDFVNEFNGLDFEYGYYLYINVFNQLSSPLTITNFESKAVNNLPPILSDISVYKFIISTNGLLRE